ncbi:MAG: ABC transporter substrate-binding protein, partial [Streptomycetaceae bacterium]|nr:ABC transporter substrate-binding protein [Streptomycetaceae bacterium]
PAETRTTRVAGTPGLQAREEVRTKQFSRIGAGDGSTLISTLKSGRVACAMTTQPTVSGAEKAGVANSVIDLATTQGVNQWLGGFVPSAGVLARADWVTSHQDTAQKVVDALVATLHYINTHSAADIAAHLPTSYVQNGLVTKADYIKALTEDKTQFLPDGMMPANGPQTVFAIQKLAGNIKGSVDLSKTYTNQYVIAANKLEGYNVSSSG